MLRNWPSSAKVADWLDNMPEGKTANWVLGNHDNWRIGSRCYNHMYYLARIHASSKIWMWWYKINSQCKQEEEDMLRFGAGNMDGFNMIGLLLPGVAVTYNGEEIGIFLAPGVGSVPSLVIHQCNIPQPNHILGMTNTAVSWEDTVDPAGRNCGQEHFQDPGCSRSQNMKWANKFNRISTIFWIFSKQWSF